MILLTCYISHREDRAYQKVKKGGIYKKGGASKLYCAATTTPHS